MGTQLVGLNARPLPKFETFILALAIAYKLDDVELLFFLAALVWFLVQPRASGDSPPDLQSLVTGTRLHAADYRLTGVLPFFLH